MTFSNPLQALMQMGRGPIMNALPNIQKPAQNPPINIQQLKQALPQLTKENYAQLVSQARAQGISEQDIESGLNFLLQLN
jgi:hypothetical protein|nr:MAG TPA: Protein of unknown function (DUF768) [Caudoviricetes sp.]